MKKTLDDILNDMKQCAKATNLEVAHENADALLVETIQIIMQYEWFKLSPQKLQAILNYYDATGKWYG